MATKEEMEKFKVACGDDVDDFSEDEDSTASDKKSEKERDTWSGEFEFVLSVVGYTVGLSNIWRFPYFCFRNGGGIAIIPFLLFLILCGGPLYYIEVCLGQYSGKSPFSVWNICPLFKGVGVVMVSVSLMYAWEFGLALSWVLYFLIQSFYPDIPWANCNNSWNSEYCIDSTTNVTEKRLNLTGSNNMTSSNIKFNTSGTEFWLRNVLDISPGIHDLGSIQLHLVGCMFIAWLLVFLCLCRGVKSLGKVVYVTATLPYVLLTVLVIRGVTLDGAWNGLRYYFIPDWSKLARGQVWVEAAIQCFFSLGPAYGGVITMASFNKFHHSALRDTLIVCFADAFTAVYGGIAVFSVLGFLSGVTGTPMEELEFSGPGLAFIAYPEALSRLPGAHVWSVLFFFTLVFVGVDSLFGAFETVNNSVIDMNYAKLNKYRLWITAALIVCIFILSLPLTTSGGYYTFILVDWYFSTLNITITALLECIIVAWIYGANRFSSDIESMTGTRPSIITRFMWCFMIPLFMGGIIITISLGYSPPSITGYTFPHYSLIIGNIIAVGPLVCLVGVAIAMVILSEGTLYQRLCTCLRPSSSWEPHDTKQQKILKNNPYEYESNFLSRFMVDIFGVRQRR
ncbi:hypothetical protein ACF0H5_019805 [Mactra antiquata]